MGDLMKGDCGCGGSKGASAGPLDPDALEVALAFEAEGLGAPEPASLEAALAQEAASLAAEGGNLSADEELFFAELEADQTASLDTLIGLMRRHPGLKVTLSI